MEGVEIGNITIPAIKGDKGYKGDAGKIISLSVTMLSSTATPTVTNTGTESEAKYELGIPRGTGVSSAVINEDGELVITLTDNTELNLGVIVPTSISNVTLDANYDFIVTFSDGTTTTVGNISTQIASQINTALTDYYDKDTTEDILDDIIDDIKVNYGHSLSLSLNQSTYVMTIGLVDYNGTTLDTKTIDLPLESVVVSGSYDKTTKEVVLTLQSGSTVRFSVADLVSGLQTEITNANKLSADLVDDTSTTHKFVTSAQKTIIDSVKTNYAHTLTLGYTASTQELAIGIADYNGTVLDTGIADLTDLARKSYVDGLIGDIDTALDLLNGEVIS